MLKRISFVFLGLTLVALFAFYPLSLVGRAAAAPLLLITETPSPTPTDTPTPTSTPAPVNTPAPVQADPLITKAVDVQQARVGDVVLFTITAFNPNNVDIPDVTVVDALPPQIDLVSANASQGTFSLDAATRTLTFSIGRLTPSQGVSLTIKARVNDLGVPGEYLRNLAIANGRIHSEVVSVLIVPSNLPATGLPPRRLSGFQLALLALAAGLPLLGWKFARRR